MSQLHIEKENYRPVSALLLFSKFFEKLFYDQYSEYLGEISK